MNRYFLVSYMLNRDFSTTYGHIVCNTYNDNYINLEALARLINEDLRNVIITNIIELSQEDHDYFIKKENENE